MDKGTKKIKYNRQVIETLKEKYGLSDYYIRKSVSGKTSGITPDKIRKDYAQLEKAIEQKKIEFKNK